MIGDFIRYGLSNFKERKIRTWLTMIGIFIGIAAVVALISLGQGLKSAISEQFEKLGADKIIVSPAGSFLGINAAGINLGEKDMDTIKQVSGVLDATGMLYKLAKVEFRNEVQYSFVIGLPLDEGKRVIESVASIEIANGRDLVESDMYAVLAGIRYYEADFFDESVTINDNLEIEGKKFRVIGTVERIGNPEDDAQLYIPIDAAREIFNEPDKYDTIMAQADKGADVSQVAEELKRKLRKSRGVKEGEEDFTVQTSEQLMESFGTVLTIVQAVLIGIAAISLLVGGVNIMNTMYTSVLQRTQEIGIMKAIGAKNSDIFQIFVLESGMLGVAGGIVGIILGVAMSQMVVFAAVQSGITIFRASFPWYLTVGALAFSFVVGALSGLLPAIQASRQKPVDALRYE